MPTIPKFFSLNNRPTGTGISFDPKEGKTMQSFKDECNINNIVSMYCKTGIWGNSLKPATSKPMFGDFASVPDFVESQNIIAKSKELFDAMPLKIRQRFNFNPVELLEFVNNPDNKDEAIKLGIATEKAAPVETKPPETPPTATS